MRAADRGHGHLARTVAAAPAMEARRRGELRAIRPDPDHLALLGAPAAHLSRRSGIGNLPEHTRGRALSRRPAFPTIWLYLSLIFVVERVITVRYRGWWRMALAA